MAKHTVINRIRLADTQARQEMATLGPMDWDYKDRGEYLADSILRRLQGDAKAYNVAYSVLGISPYCPKHTMRVLSTL